MVVPDHVMLVDDDISGGLDGSMASVVAATLSVLLR